MATSLHTAHHVIDLIVRQSKQKIQEHKIAKTMSVPYSNAIIQNKKNDIMLHSGINYDKPTGNFFKRQLESQQKPTNNIKDTYTFFSVKKCKQDKKQNSQISVPKQQSSKKALKKFFKSATYKTTQHQTQSKKATIEQDSKQSSFIKLDLKKEFVPEFLQRQDKNIEDLRQIKNHQILQRETARHNDETESQITTQRQNKLASYLQNHLSRQNNQHTYDVEGNLLLFSTENNRKAITKAYPPTIRYEVLNEDHEAGKRLKGRSRGYKNRIQSNLELKRKEKMDPNIEGAKGEIFKSSVLKTINLSRLSFANEQFDEAQFMKRNDLFNNNHSRQTTSIPFVKMQIGSLFKETATNQWVQNKQVEADAESRKGSQKPSTETRARSHESRYRKDFKKFSFSREPQTCSNSFIEKFPEKRPFPATSKNSRNINSIGDTRYSSFYAQRPHTTEVGRIKRENDFLFHSMLEQ